jgi:UDP-N-acetylmuramyl pentapeptide phosphotransferase/UDP-N-acetylglucosamine-1-phosphate transferase
MDGSGLTAFLISLIVSLAMAPAVRRLACRISLYSRAPETELDGDPVPLLGGVALAGGALTGVFSSGGLGGLLVPLLVCSLLMAALGLMRDLWPLRSATVLVWHFLVAALVVKMLPPIRLGGGPVVDTLIAIGWLVVLGSALAALDRLPRVALPVGVVAAALAVAGGAFGELPAIERALLAAAGAATGLLIYTVAFGPLLPGHVGALFLGGWLAAAALLAPPSLQVDQMIIIGAPLALALIALKVRSTMAGHGAATVATDPGTVRRFAYRGYEVLVDVALIAASYYGALAIRFDEADLSHFLPYFVKSLPVVIGCQLVALWSVGKYHRLRFVPGITDAGMMMKGVLFGVASAVVLLLYLYRFEGFSRWVFAIQGASLSFLLLGYPRLIAGTGRALKPRRLSRKVLIYGAGRAGALLLRELLQNEELAIAPLGFIDDDPAKRRLKLDGFPVLGTIRDLPGVLVRQTVSEVLISTRLVSSARLAALVSVCREHGVGIRRMRLMLEDVEPPAPAETEEETQEQQATAGRGVSPELRVTPGASS